jgi:hypothetical protein
MNDRLKTMLKATDDEWAVIQPLLAIVQADQRAMTAARLGGFGGFGGGRRGGGQGGAGGPGGAAGANGATRSPEADALRTALASDATSDADIKTKLEAFRDARKKQADALEQARQDLEKVLTLRQEATLVQMGVLE